MSSEVNDEQKVTIELTNDEALVIYEWIARFHTEGSGEFVDEAESSVLWDIECILEALLVEPLKPEYTELVKSARARVRGSEE